MNTDSNSPATTDHSEQPSTTAARPWRHWAIWIGAVCILVGGSYLLFSQRTSAQQSAAGKRKGGGGAIPVSVVTVQKGNMGVYINALGTVTPVYTDTIASRVVGQLMEVNYKEGQLVKKGELLAVIDPRPYEATYVQAQGQLERDQALLKNARIDLDRYTAAYSQHAIPEQTLATQQATVKQDEGTVKLDEGNLAAAKVNVDYTRITAPISGRVGLRAVDPGNIVPANGTTGLVTIAQLQPITIIFTVAEDYISEIVTQMQTGRKLTVEALNRDNQQKLAEGTLLTLDNQIDTTTGTVRARATFANKDNKLFPNEFVNAKLLVKTLMGVNIIPTAAVQRNNEIAFVYVVNLNKTVQSRNITIATSDGNNAAVTGVSPGEQLVTDGFDKLQDGIGVSIRKPSQQTTQTPAAQQNEANENVNTAQQNPQGGGKK
jgi:membrane fusion protein, multidrug efflux system